MPVILGEAFPAMPVLVTSVSQELSTEMTNDLLSPLVRTLLDRLSEAGWGCAGQYIADCVALGRFSDLCVYDPDVLDLSAADQYLIRQCLAFFRKRKDIDLGVDREATALLKFWESERACALTNACFRAWSQGRFQFRPEVERILHAAQLKISDLLGDVPTLREIRSRFGPGATTQVAKKNACPIIKLGSTPACSANFTWASEAISLVFPADGREPLELDVEIHAAKLAFVDKNAKTKRAICTEPALNGMFQLGLGELMADKLRRVGIDIRDQSANQRAAMYGSISNDSATIDLSSASDTIALKLVEHLLSPEWYELLSNLRSAEMSYKGETFVLEKISSMGNGFTFPLETLIFWAISASVSEMISPRSRIRTLVYGDDIVVDAKCAPTLMRVLSDLGFTPNMEKSFLAGGFRESCGKDYVFGIDVRPVFVDDALIGIDLFRLHNFFHTRRDFSVASWIERVIHPSIRLWGPKGFGDGYLHRENWDAVPVNRRGWGGFTFESWTFRPKTLKGEIARRLAQRKRFAIPRWDPDGRRWVTGTQTNEAMIFRPGSAFLVRRLATYTQYLRENRVLTLTESDRKRTAERHVYCDRRMPDAQNPGSDEDIFVVPGQGLAVRTKIYIFEPPAPH